jgi:hypothetical protein
MTKEEEFFIKFRQLAPKDQEYVTALARQQLAEARDAGNAKEKRQARGR